MLKSSSDNRTIKETGFTGPNVFLSVNVRGPVYFAVSARESPEAYMSWHVKKSWQYVCHRALVTYGICVDMSSILKCLDISTHCCWWALICTGVLPLVVSMKTIYKQMQFFDFYPLPSRQGPRCPLSPNRLINLISLSSRRQKMSQRLGRDWHRVNCPFPKVPIEV